MCWFFLPEFLILLSHCEGTESVSVLDQREAGRPYLIAHRGNSAACPENSLQAFQRAARDRADIIETDVRVSADGHFVLIHDPTLERTTDGTGRVDSLTLEQLKSCGLRNADPSEGSPTVPTLEEMALAVPAPMVFALELKARDFRRTEACQALAEALARLDLTGRTLILSSHRRHLEAWRRVSPDVPVGLVAWGSPLPPRGFDLLGPLWPALALNPRYITVAHRRGQLVCPLDPRPDRRLSWYLRAGCDAILSDDPGRTRAVLDRETRA
jgi:glycerophosphoryl diester phosphodiesterase